MGWDYSAREERKDSEMKGEKQERNKAGRVKGESSQVATADWSWPGTSWIRVRI